MNIDDLFPSKYLKAADAEKNLDLTIARVAQEGMKNKEGKDEIKPVLYFAELEKGMVLNKTNAKTLSGLFGKEIDHWAGERVVLTAVEVDAFGEMQKALRIKNAAPATNKADLLARYQKLYEEARKLNVSDLDTFALSAEATEAEIIDVGKLLRKAVDAAKAF
jgi:hypothetical protein